MIREMWRASASPRAFFEALEPQSTHIWRGALAAAVGFVGLALACALGFIRATDSDAYTPILTFALLFGLGLFLYIWGFGSLFVQRPGALDVRAWEVSGWSWGAALFLGLSMLPALWFFPAPALLLTLFGAVVWHLNVLRAGLKVFLGRPVWRVLSFYAVFVYLGPLTILAGLVLVFS